MLYAQYGKMVNVLIRRFPVLLGRLLVSLLGRRDGEENEMRGNKVERNGKFELRAGADANCTFVQTTSTPITTTSET